MRIIDSVAPVRILAAAAALSLPIAVAAPAATRASVPAPKASLRVSSSSPRQLAGVLLDASASTGSVATYTFHYGDGIVESSYSPLAMHGYAQTGVYRATVVVTDASGRQAASPPVTVRVRDGLPPVVSITSPRPGQRLRLRPAGALITGRATDAGGVRRVQLAIQLTGAVSSGNCVWYNGRRGLVASPCGAPYFFPAGFARGHWRFRINRHARIPSGTYVVRARATDRSGNVSHFYAVSLRTILPFELVR